jgi:hypothetical protein
MSFWPSGGPAESRFSPVFSGFFRRYGFRKKNQAEEVETA